MCHLDTTFGFLQQCIKYTRRKGCTAAMIERLSLAIAAIIEQFHINSSMQCQFVYLDKSCRAFSQVLLCFKSSRNSIQMQSDTSSFQCHST